MPSDIVRQIAVSPARAGRISRPVGSRSSSTMFGATVSTPVMLGFHRMV
jgi:hypothetical protein